MALHFYSGTHYPRNVILLTAVLRSARATLTTQVVESSELRAVGEEVVVGTVLAYAR